MFRKTQIWKGILIVAVLLVVLTAAAWHAWHSPHALATLEKRAKECTKTITKGMSRTEARKAIEACGMPLTSEYDKSTWWVRDDPTAHYCDIFWKQCLVFEPSVLVDNAGVYISVDYDKDERVVRTEVFVSHGTL